MTYARIIGTGSYVPDKVLTNADLSRMLGEDVDAFVSNVLGIRERHVCGEDESTADLATEAARRALAAAGVRAEDLDLIRSDAFVSNVLGIRERHVCGEDESTADLATEAARRALAAAGVRAEDLDLI